MFKHNLLPIFIAPILFSTCFASENLTIDNPGLRKALKEAKEAVEKTYLYADANDKQYAHYRSAATKYISEINSLLVLEKESMNLTAPSPTSTTKEAHVIVKQSAAAIHTPSPLEERYAKIGQSVLWFKDLQIMGAIEYTIPSYYINLASTKSVQSFLVDFFQLLKTTSKEKLLNNLEKYSQDTDVQRYNFEKNTPLAKYILPLVHRLGITAHDIQASKELKLALTDILANKEYNPTSNFQTLEDKVARIYENYKKGITYK